MVTSTHDAIDQHKNTLSTGSLTVSDIENHTDYKGQSVGLSGGTGMNTPIVMAASDSASSTTISGISGADIAITDEQKQQEHTGKTGEQALAELKRDVAREKDSSGALKPIFDKAAIEAGFEVVSAFAGQV